MSRTLEQWLESSEEDDAKKPTPKRSGSTHRHHHHHHHRSSHASASPVVAPEGEAAVSRRDSLRQSSRSPSASGYPSPHAASSSPPPAGSREPSPRTSQASVAKQQRLREADDRHRKQEELKEKMRAALGTDRVEALTAGPAVAQNATRPGINDSLSSSQNSLASLPHGHGAAAGAAANSKANRPPTAPTSSDGTLRKLDINAMRSSDLFKEGLTPKRPSFDLGAPSPGGDANVGSSATGLPPYGIFVVDEGTQTACTVECQTDPDPRSFACNGCYADYYGHPPPLGPGYDGFGPSDAVRGSGLAELLDRFGVGYGGPHAHHRAAAAKAAIGGAHNHLALQYPAADAAAQGKVMAALRLQLQQVQSAVDGFVRKYNLPPPASAL